MIMVEASIWGNQEENREEEWIERSNGKTREKYCHLFKIEAQYTSQILFSCTQYSYLFYYLQIHIQGQRV